MGWDAEKISFDSNRLRWTKKHNYRNTTPKRVRNSDLSEWVNKTEDWADGAIRDGTMLPKHLEQIAEKLNVSYDYLLGKKEEPASEDDIRLFVKIFGHEPHIDHDGILLWPYRKYHQNRVEAEKKARQDMLVQYLSLLGKRGVEGFHDDGTGNFHDWVLDGNMYEFSENEAASIVFEGEYSHFEIALIRFISQYLSEHNAYFGRKLPPHEIKIVE